MYVPGRAHVNWCVLAERVFVPHKEPSIIIILEKSLSVATGPSTVLCTCNGDAWREMNDALKKKKKLWSCVTVEVAALGSPSITVLMVSVDVKQRQKKKRVNMIAVDLAQPSEYVTSGPVTQQSNDATAEANGPERLQCVLTCPMAMQPFA